MTIKDTEEPLFGFEWNEALLDPLFNRGMLTLIAFDNEGIPSGLGTAFIVKRNNRSAICVTAAHVFTEVRRIQSPPQRHARSALPEFLPPPLKIDLSRKKIRAVAIEGNRTEALAVNSAIIDEIRDIAIFEITLQNEDTPSFFSNEFEADDKVPSAGEIICLLSYGELSTHSFETDGAMKRQFRMSRRPVLRVGKVIANYSDGHRLCRGPCIETTIPVYSGMSGGPAFMFGSTGAPMRPFGLICSDPDPDGSIKEDRNHAGSSIISILPCKVTKNELGQRQVEFEFLNPELAGSLSRIERSNLGD